MKGQFSAAGLSKCARRAIHQRGLFMVGSYDHIGRFVTTTPEYQVVLRAYSTSGEKSVDVRAIDMWEAREYYYGPWMARVKTAYPSKGEKLPLETT